MKMSFSGLCGGLLDSLRRKAGIAALAVTALVIGGASRAVEAGPLDGIGIVGTSLSEEYSTTEIFQAINAGYPGAGVNWMEVLAATRPQLNFGQFSTNWGGLRQGGYEFNWAEGGATSASIISTGQVNGLAGQVASGQVKMAVIEIGMNDFLAGNVPLVSIATGAMDGAARTAFLDGIVNNVRQMVETIQAAAPEPIPIVVLNAPHPGGVPLGKMLIDAFAPIFPPAPGNVDSALAEMNQRINDLAASHGVIVADIHASSLEWAQNEFVTIGNTPVKPFDQAFVSSLGIDFRALADDPVALAAAYDALTPEQRQELESWAFLPDGFHPNTVASAIVANQFLAAINANLGANVPLLTPDEILFAAGIQPVPEPGTLALAACGLFGLTIVAVRRRARK